MADEEDNRLLTTLSVCFKLDAEVDRLFAEGKKQNEKQIYKQCNILNFKKNISLDASKKAASYGKAQFQTRYAKIRKGYSQV